MSLFSSLPNRVTGDPQHPPVLSAATFIESHEQYEFARMHAGLTKRSGRRLANVYLGFVAMLLIGLLAGWIHG